MSHAQFISAPLRLSCRKRRSQPFSRPPRQPARLFFWFGNSPVSHGVGSFYASDRLSSAVICFV